MYREFSIVSVYTSLIDRTVQIDFTLDIDPDSVLLDSIVLCDKASGKIMPAHLSVNRKTVTMHLQSWPNAKTEYLLRIQAGIRSIVDDRLPDSLQRVIVFKSEILSTVEILSPSHHEVLDALYVSWREEAEDKEAGLVSSYYLEIAKENAFYNLVVESEIVDKTAITLTDVEAGQYYLRMRAQKNKDYGQWSEVITFLVKPKTAIAEEPEIIEDLAILEQPKNGETPASFIFTFDEEIDIDCMPEITVRRRPI